MPVVHVVFSAATPLYVVEERVSAKIWSWELRATSLDLLPAQLSLSACLVAIRGILPILTSDIAASGRRLVGYTYRLRRSAHLSFLSAFTENLSSSVAGAEHGVAR